MPQRHVAGTKSQYVRTQEKVDGIVIVINCDQFCYGDGCNSKCDAEKCSLVCTGGACNMTCPSGVKECNLHCVLGGSCNSKCNAEKCSLDCGGGACNMTCPSGVKECHLNCADGKCHFNCDAEHCQRNCAGGCRTPIDPGSGITCNRCWPPSYCNAEKCTLPCTWGGCNMSCPSSVKYCDQICTGGRCRSKCDAEKCVLGCTGGGCNMACPSGVKECNLYCTGGGCHFDCDAEKCTLDCTGGGCTEVKSTTTKRPGSSSGSSLQVGAHTYMMMVLAQIATTRSARRLASLLVAICDQNPHHICVYSCAKCVGLFCKEIYHAWSSRETTTNNSFLKGKRRSAKAINQNT
ncbi:uncharacterized protein LOC144637136 [Oculina patagonica]